MLRLRHLRRLVFLVVTAIALASPCGCATWKMPEALGPGPGLTRAQRRQEAVRLFEDNRTKAELESARACLERGDVKGCRETVAQVLQRQKDNREALLLQAEAYLADGRYDEAKRHLETVLAAAPKDAEALLMMAQTLDASGDSHQSLDAYRLAAEAAPGNEACVLAYKAALQAVDNKQGRGEAEIAGGLGAGKGVVRTAW